MGGADQTAGGLHGLIARVDEIDRSDHDARITALTELIEHPGAAGALVDVAGVLDEIHQHHRARGRFDDAVTAKRAAIEAGYQSTPDPEADVAEMYVEQGRLDDAGMLFAVLRERAQDDVWLYNSAAWAYGPVEPATSLRWALDGIDKAFETGDPDRVIDQLRDFAVQAWTALGLPVDDALLAQVDEFVAVWEPVTARPETSHASPLTPSSAPKRVAAAARAGTAYGMAWFPATEWASATRRWPDLLDHAPAEHQAYCRIIEARLKTLHRTAPGISQHVSPITVSELDALATNSGEDAGTGTVRSHLAAEVVRTGRAVAWPPKRNDRCWCGSGRKYKQCCGPTPASILGEETYG